MSVPPSDPLPLEAPISCPHCGRLVTRPQSYCPNCGTASGGVWPPAPTLGEPRSPARPRTLTGRAWTDFLLGASVQYLTHLATARVLVASVPMTSTSRDWVAQATVPGSFVVYEMFWALLFGALLYYGLRRTYPIVARGSGYATLALLAVLLGAFFTCRPLTY